MINVKATITVNLLNLLKNQLLPVCSFLIILFTISSLILLFTQSLEYLAVNVLVNQTLVFSIIINSPLCWFVISVQSRILFSLSGFYLLYTELKKLFYNLLTKKAIKISMLLIGYQIMLLVLSLKHLVLVDQRLCYFPFVRSGKETWIFLLLSF